jgi:hypothetical protein
MECLVENLGEDYQSWIDDVRSGLRYSAAGVHSVAISELVSRLQQQQHEQRRQQQQQTFSMPPDPVVAAGRGTPPGFSTSAAAPFAQGGGWE